MPMNTDSETVAREESQRFRLELRAKLFRGLGDATRLAILEALRGGELKVVDIVRIVNGSQSNVSEHLSCLRDCGLVTARPDGRATYYALAEKGMEDVLSAVDTVMGNIARRVCDCSRYRQ